MLGVRVANEDNNWILRYLGKSMVDRNMGSDPAQLLFLQKRRCTTHSRQGDTRMAGSIFPPNFSYHSLQKSVVSWRLKQGHTYYYECMAIMLAFDQYHRAEPETYVPQ